MRFSVEQVNLMGGVGKLLNALAWGWLDGLVGELSPESYGFVGEGFVGACVNGLTVQEKLGGKLNL